jgi:hypothetical protein
LDQSGHDADIERCPTPLSLAALAQRDDEHVAVLKVDERAPELVHAGRPVFEVDPRG